MLSTKTLITDIYEVPREWVFEYYLKLGENLNGQDVKIKSAFNPKDKTPSMCIYIANNSTYRYKDFSSGKSGDSIDLVKELFNLTTRGETAHKIMTDYNNYIIDNKERVITGELKKQAKYKVVDFKKRSWTNLDAKFWTKFQIGSKDLEFWNIQPLESYKLEKKTETETLDMIISGNNTYGYFRKDGTLYKIYQPYNKDNKFIKVRDYIQGSDQQTLAVSYLVICSSLKDIIALSKVGYTNIEAVAPDSENILIPENIIAIYKNKYKAIFSMFDNDAPGIKAMTSYKEKYSIPSIILPLSKDISDSVRDYGLIKVKQVLTPLLKQALQ